MTTTLLVQAGPTISIDPNPLVAFLVSLVPLLLILTFVYVFLVRNLKRNQVLINESANRHAQALEVARASDEKLARIVNLLERQARSPVFTEALEAEEVDLREEDRP